MYQVMSYPSSLIRPLRMLSVSLHRMWSGDWFLGQSSVFPMAVATSLKGISLAHWSSVSLSTQLSFLTCWFRFFLSSRLRFRLVCHEPPASTTYSLPRHSFLGLSQPRLTPPAKVTPSYKLSVKLLPVWKEDAFACWDTPFSATLRPSSQVEESPLLKSWWSNQWYSCVRHL